MRVAQTEVVEYSRLNPASVGFYPSPREYGGLMAPGLLNSKRLLLRQVAPTSRSPRLPRLHDELSTQEPTCPVEELAHTSPAHTETVGDLAMVPDLPVEAVGERQERTQSKG